MWQRGNNFGVIPGGFDGDNGRILSYCGREN